MPRKSRASLEVKAPTVRPHQRIKPRAGLPKDVAVIFGDIVASVPANHFVPSDLPLLEGYSHNVALGREACAHLRQEGQVIEGRVSPWVTCLEKAMRACVALSMRLRLSPQSRLRPETVGRSKMQPPSYFETPEWQMRNGGWLDD